MYNDIMLKASFYKFHKKRKKKTTTEIASLVKWVLDSCSYFDVQVSKMKPYLIVTNSKVQILFCMRNSSLGHPNFKRKSIKMALGSKV
jgi:hypothetical protein